MSSIESVSWSRPEDERQGTLLVVALHGRGADERSMAALVPFMPEGVTLAALRGPVRLPGGFTWFENKGVGRPVEASIKETAAAVLSWLREVEAQHTGVVVMGFSGGTAMAGGLLFSAAERFSGAVLLSGTLPWDAGFETPQGLLSGMPVFWSIDPHDPAIPRELWTRSRDWLVEDSGADVQEHVYPGVGHGIAQSEAEDITAFLTELSS